jgi:hypothetical protein
MSPGIGQESVYEEQHVHQVYEQIASHFSSTRYKVSQRRVKGERSTRLTDHYSHGLLLRSFSMNSSQAPWDSMLAVGMESILQSIKTFSCLLQTGR